jgi:hypothetical protein
MLHASACLRQLVDVKQMRVDLVRQRLDAARTTIELEARRRVAVLAAVLALGGGAALGGLAGQLPLIASLGVTTAAAGLVASQVRALGHLGARWTAEASKAEAGLEKLDRLGGCPT